MTISIASAVSVLSPTPIVRLKDAELADLRMLLCGVRLPWGVLGGSVADPRFVCSAPSAPFVYKYASVTRLALSTFFGVVKGPAIGRAIASVLIRRFAGRTPKSLVGMTGVPAFEESFDKFRIR